MLTHTITSTITTHQCCGSGQHIFSISGSDHIMKKRIPLLSSIAEPTHFRAPSPFWRLLERRIYIPSKFLIKQRNIQTGNNEQYELRFKDKKIKPFMFLTKKLRYQHNFKQKIVEKLGALLNNGSGSAKHFRICIWSGSATLTTNTHTKNIKQQC